MKPDFKVSIPEPCNENWDKMTPNEKGRFCTVCNTTVIDFTKKLPSEIQQYFIQNENQKVCGRFLKSQTELVDIRIPSSVFFSQNQYHKIFLLALFIAMGTSLFSCSDNNGNKHKIDSITIDQEKVRRDRELNQLIKQMRNPNRGISMGDPGAHVDDYENTPSFKKKSNNKPLAIDTDTTQIDCEKIEIDSEILNTEDAPLKVIDSTKQKTN